MAKIYVSSTFSDLQECRKKVRLAIKRMGHEDIAMEYYVAEHRRPLDRCLADVRACDLYVGIFAFRYGYVPDEYDKSITELEFRTAVENKKDCLIFLLKEGASWPVDQIEFQAYERIKALRDELGKKYLAGFFTGEDDIEARILEAINKWEKERGITVKSEHTDWDAYKQAVFEEHRWVRLAVIAGAKQDRIARIPLTDIFVPQRAETGLPTYEVPDEVIHYKRRLFTIQPEQKIETEMEVQSLEEKDDVEALEEASLLTGGFPEPVLKPVLKPVLDILAREQTQVILGGPGSGKSTLLHYALLKLCDLNYVDEAPTSNLQNLPIPFLIELRQYVIKKASSFIDYIVTNAKEKYSVYLQAKNIEALLGEQKRALVFFDGLDEIFDPAERFEVIGQFKTFARQYPQAQIVVTSRIVGYDKTELGVAGFEHYTLLDFDVQQIREFIPKWYQFYTWEGDERDAKGLIQRISDSPRLMDLAGNPLLLTMMAVIYKHQDLPEQRWKLYERCTEVLLEDWDIKRKSFKLEQILPLDINIRGPQKAEILQRVSMYMLEHGQSGRELNAISYQPLMAILAKYFKEKYDKSQGDAEAIAQDILYHLRLRTYILAEVGEGIFGFVHRTFMEYFAACHCKAEFNTRKSDYGWLTKEIFGVYWQQDDWQEVLLLLVAMLADQKSPIREVVDYLYKECQVDPPSNIIFAARCLGEAGIIKSLHQAQNMAAEKVVKAIVTHVTRFEENCDSEFVNTGLVAISMLAPMIDITPQMETIIKNFDDFETLQEQVVARRISFALRSKIQPEYLDFAFNPAYIEILGSLNKWLYDNQSYWGDDADL